MDRRPPKVTKVNEFYKLFTIAVWGRCVHVGISVTFRNTNLF